MEKAAGTWPAAAPGGASTGSKDRPAAVQKSWRAGQQRIKLTGGTGPGPPAAVARTSSAVRRPAVNAGQREGAAQLRCMDCLRASGRQSNGCLGCRASSSALNRMEGLLSWLSRGGGLTLWPPIQPSYSWHSCTQPCPSRSSLQGSHQWRGGGEGMQRWHGQAGEAAWRAGAWWPSFGFSCCGLNVPGQARSEEGRPGF